MKHPAKLFNFPAQVFSAWLMSLLTIAYFSSAFFGQRPPMAELLTKWDAGWYSSVSTQGYSYTEGQQSNVAFFPLYPLVAKALALLTGNWALAALLTSLASFFVALQLLHAL